MRKPLLLCLLALIATSQTAPSALVGGTLVDVFGGRPLRNSVVIID